MFVMFIMQNMSFDLEIDIFDVVWISLLVFNIYMMIRNTLVFRERERLRKIIFEKNDDGNYKYNEKEVIELMDKSGIMVHDYMKMVFQFWKPVKSYYRDFLSKLESGVIPDGTLSDGRSINETINR